jgi:hypothetical protein
MNPHEQERASQLGRLWDAVAQGGSLPDADAGLLSEIQFVQEVTAVPTPPATLRATVWQQVNGRPLAAAVSTAAVAPSPNGVAAHPVAPVSGAVTRGRRASTWLAMARIIAIGAMAGFGAGFLAGLWTRAAMRLSGFLTVDRNRSLITDNDAVVGQVTFGGTLFLALMGAAIGILGGVLYVAIRRWLPRRTLVRAGAYGIFLLAVFGFIVMDEHNPDYRLFGPTWLNVGTFSLTYLVYGVLVSIFAEGLDARMPTLSLRRGAGWRTRLATLALLPFAVFGTLGVLFSLLSTKGSSGAAIISAMFIVYALTFVLRRMRWRPPTSALRFAGATAILVPGLFGVYLTIQGIAGILIG